MTDESDWGRRLVAEALGTSALLATVVGSGIMAARLAEGNEALALLGNTLPYRGDTGGADHGAGPGFGGAFQPCGDLGVSGAGGRSDFAMAVAYMVVQIAGGAAGMLAAHAMFDLPLLQASTKVRTGVAQWFSEWVATFGLVGTIFCVLRFRAEAVAYAVGLYITAAYWFTASTSFANPAVTVARSWTDTFSGIAPAHAPAFMLAQIIGALSAAGLCGWLVSGPVPRQTPRSV